MPQAEVQFNPATFTTSQSNSLRLEKNLTAYDDRE
jgi:hypothetical protein